MVMNYIVLFNVKLQGEGEVSGKGGGGTQWADVPRQTSINWSPSGNSQLTA